MKAITSEAEWHTLMKKEIGESLYNLVKIACLERLKPEKSQESSRTFKKIKKYPKAIDFLLETLTQEELVVKGGTPVTITSLNMGILDSMYLLGELREVRAFRHLVAILGWENPMFVMKAKDALVRIGNPAVDELIRAMQSEKREVVRYGMVHPVILDVIEVLGRIGDPSAIPALRKMLIFWNLWKWKGFKERIREAIERAIDSIQKNG